MNTATISYAGKLLRLFGLIDTKDVTPYQNTFIRRMREITREAKQTSHLSEGQLTFIDELFEKHFAA